MKKFVGSGYEFTLHFVVGLDFGHSLWLRNNDNIIRKDVESGAVICKTSAAIDTNQMHDAVIKSRRINLSEIRGNNDIVM